MGQKKRFLLQVNSTALNCFVPKKHKPGRDSNLDLLLVVAEAMVIA
jgi:hypothetical protein